MNINKILLLFCICILNAEPLPSTTISDHNTTYGLNRVDDYGYPNNPLYDRAKGYLLKGKAKTAVSNSGNFSSWDYHPSGFWGEYGYLPDLSFVLGVPGHEYSSHWSSPSYSSWLQDSNNDSLWFSTDAYNAWIEGVNDPVNNVGNYKTIVYNTVVDMGNDDRGHNDRGIIATEIVAYCTNTDIFENDTPNQTDCESFGYEWIFPGIGQINPSGGVQWFLDHELGRLYLFLDDDSLDPNSASAGIGLAFPWAIRPAFQNRSEGSGGFYFDQYNYGADLEEWTDDDEYVYYGANTAESWFMDDAAWGTSSIKTDWQATSEARYNTHNLDNTAGDIFGDTDFVDPYDPDALLAHSTYPETWPEKSIGTGSYEPFWPGWWADEYYGDSPASWLEVGIYDCDGTPADDGCWKPLVGRHISDMDVYMEFDDRWANVGNGVVDNEYVSSGYPMGIKVMASGHSYGQYLTEDIMFFTVKIRNESGDFCAFERDKNQMKVDIKDENGFLVCGEGMIMPDGTKLNRGGGFDYKKISTGFYMDADVLATDINGTPSGAVHTPSDDFMQYIDCKTSPQWYPEGCPTVNGDPFRISMAVIGDYDGYSNAASGYSMRDDENKGSDFGVVAVQLLDSPYSTGYVDLDQDGFFDISPGEKLKMTDFHWFDWWNRPGVLYSQQSSDAAAKNKELIQYQVMAGDNTNLTYSEKVRYFHTANPQTDLDSELNPHFDSLEGLTETEYFIQDQNGLDALLQMTTGPFDLEVGEQVNMSFVILFGQNIDDLKDNALTAQILYNNHYSMPPSPSMPSPPELTVTPGTYSVALSWDDSAESSIDYLTETADFQGYRIYRSLDGGETWGDTLYNVDGQQGEPIAQFDLIDDISGMDPLAPGVNLGNNSGLQHTYTDTGLFSYSNYCYAVTAYDSGLEPGDYDEDWFDFSDGYPSLESSINANKICVSLPILPIYNPPADVLFEEDEANVGSSDIEYIVHNDEVTGLYKFEIQAEIDSNTFLFSETLNPELFVYEVDENGNQISEYLVQDFPIYSLYEEGGEYEWLDILGMYIKIENLNSNLDNNPLALVELEEVMFSDTLLSDIIDVKMRWKNYNDMPLQPYFDYRIELNSDFIDYAYQTTENGCSDMPEGNTPLPFAITNITTDKQVKVQHLDKGIEAAGISFGEVYSGECVPVCMQAEICVEDQCVPLTGYNNCQWERNEIFVLIDTVNYYNSANAEKIFNLKIDLNLGEYYDNVGADLLNTNIWVEGETYFTGEIVYHEGMLYQSTEDVSISNAPDEWFDNNGDDINDNPWQILYPWEDGDSAMISIRKKLHDGDSWLVDISKIGDCSANLGNVNDDNNINILDVVRIINVVVGNAEFATNQNCTADINNDGMIDLLDSVALINIIMGYNDSSLSGTGGSKQIDINVGLNLINIHSDEAFGGVQLDLEGDYSFTNIDFPSGWELYQGDKGIIAININRQGEKSDLILSYEGDLKIINHLASDLFGNILASKVIGIPYKYSLNHPYPNPFNPTTTFSFSIPVDNEVTLTIYNLQGREVVSLIDANMDAGYHSVVWDANSYASGVYFVKMVAGEYVNTQKLMLIK